MELKDGSSLIAELTTTGRKSGLPRTVELRFIYFKGSLYASSSSVKGKHWCQNMIHNPVVEISARGERLSCVARQVDDDTLRRFPIP
jgi:deazaflavin-dependent oxidoreductase (nitroreductase family)